MKNVSSNAALTAAFTLAGLVVGHFGDDIATLFVGILITGAGALASSCLEKP